MYLLALGQSPQTPFWLLIAAIVAAPILAFVGMAIGALLKDRSDRRLALRQDRHRVYTEFLRLVGETHFGFIGIVTRYITALDEIDFDSEEVKNFVTMLRVNLTKIESLREEIVLIGSHRAIRSAGQAYQLTLIHAEAFSRTNRLSFDKDLYNWMVDDVYTIISDFRDAAAVDLDVPRRDRKRAKISSPSQVQISTLDEIVEAADRLRQAKPRTGDTDEKLHTGEERTSNARNPPPDS